MLETFATYGIPKMIVSDNAMSFHSKEFQDFSKNNGIKHITGSSYSPRNNGQCENVIKTLKQKLKSMRYRQISLRHKVDKFLLSYRNTLHATTN